MNKELLCILGQKVQPEFFDGLGEVEGNRETSPYERYIL
jgi:hypothetical protein